MSRRDRIAGAPITIDTSVARFPDLTGADSDSSDDGHLVALAWVVDPQRSSILLVQHRTAGWSCPGGHVEPGEHARAAARRELAEETGVHAEPTESDPVVLARSVGCPRSGPDTVHWAAGYLFVVDRSTPLTTERGQRARWFDLGDLPDHRAADIDTVVAAIRPKLG